jgi:hypothetical protein
LFFVLFKAFFICSFSSAWSFCILGGRLELDSSALFRMSR